MPDERTIGNDGIPALEWASLVRHIQKDDAMLLRRPRILLMVLALLAAAGTASARRYMQGDQCLIASSETVSGTLFVLCQNLVIDGIVDGNVIGAATNAQINGEVSNGIYMLGGELDLFGTLGADLHYLGVRLAIHESARLRSRLADLFTVAMSTQIDPEAYIPGTVTAAGYQIIIQGGVGRDVSFWGSALEIDGTVDGAVFANVGDTSDVEATAQLETLFILFPIELNLVNPGLRLHEDATVQGNLQYTAPSLGDINGRVGGDVIFDPVASQFEPPTDEAGVLRGLRQYFADVLREFLTLTLVGALGILFTPGLIQAPIQNLRRRPLTSLGLGTLTFIISVPVFAAIAILTVVATIFVITIFPATNLIFAGGLVLLILDASGASLFYFIAVFIARSMVCLALGRRVLRTVIDDDGSARYLYLGLATGALGVALLVSMPGIGLFINALVIFFGLGAIVNLVQIELTNLRENTGYGPSEAPPTGTRFGRRYDLSVDPPFLPPEAPDPPRRRPQPQEPRPRHTVGLDDLPDDFVWWDEL
jgi:cytoskeletal protein CcmA (bactofilin family)